jgi:NAD(P)-dependent dehydrogenase (short-subunit alcohol dehydrogenase family)
VSEPSTRKQQLTGQTVLVLGGSAGIGLETARRARDEGADVILTARDPDRLHTIGLELDARISTFDLNDTERLTRFFANLPGPVDHVLVSGAGPHYIPFAELDIEKIRHGLERIVLSVQIAHLVKDAVKPTGSLLLIGGTGGRRPSAGPLICAVTAAMPALARSLALELAPIRVNVIAPGFVDTALSAAILGPGLDARREQLRASLPIRRVVGPGDIAALALDLMTNTAVTGATFDIDGGQQLLDG